MKKDFKFLSIDTVDVNIYLRSLLLFEYFMKNLKIATRNSTLALWQANYIKDLLTAKCNDLKCEIIPIITQGDRDKASSLKHMGGKELLSKSSSWL